MLDSGCGSFFVPNKKEYDEFIGATAEIMSRLESYMVVTKERKQLKRMRGVEKCTSMN